MTREGVMGDKNLTSSEVSKALGAVSQISRAGHRVVFNPGWTKELSYIEHIETGEVMWLTEHNVLYVLDTKIAPTGRQFIVQMSKGFGRQANP